MLHFPSPTAPSVVTGAAPVWALLGRRTGDNEQVLALVEALGQPFTIKRLNFKRGWRPWRSQGGGLKGLSRAERAALAAPWPDVVIGVGRKSVPVARRIKAESGGAACLVQIGRPRCDPALLDLVVTTDQYGVPPADSVLRLPIALTRVTRAALDMAAATAPAQWRALPHPRRALLVGGDSIPYRLDPKAIAAAFEACVAGQAREGGSIILLTSPRTPPSVTAILESLARTAAAPVLLPRESRGLTGQEVYHAALGLADDVWVTADSASLLADAYATERPVHRIPVRMRPLVGLHVRLLRRWRLADQEGAALPFWERPLARAYAALVRLGWTGWPRDLWFLWRALDVQPNLTASAALVADALRRRCAGLGRPVQAQALSPAQSQVQVQDQVQARSSRDSGR